MLKHPAVHTALIAIAAYAVVKMIQTKVMPIPVIGAYLPGGSATTA